MGNFPNKNIKFHRESKLTQSRKKKQQQQQQQQKKTQKMQLKFKYEDNKNIKFHRESKLTQNRKKKQQQQQQQQKKAQKIQLKLKYEDFLQEDIPNLMNNVWSYSDKYGTGCTICPRYKKICIDAFKKMVKEYIDFDFVIKKF